MNNVMNTYRYLTGFFNGEAREGRALSLDFEQAAKLEGIAGDYRYPKQRTRQGYEHWAGSFCGFQNENSEKETAFLQNSWDELVALNPQLEGIDPDGRPNCLRHGIFGVASRFNPDDIRFFVELQKRSQCSMTALLVYQVPSYKALSDRVEMHTGIGRSWVASPETLVRIFEQVKDRPLEVEEPFRHFEYHPVQVSDEAKAIADSYITPVIRKAGLAL